MAQEIFLSSSSKWAEIEQILVRQVLRARFLGSNFTTNEIQELNLGWVGEKRKCYVCAMLMDVHCLWSLLDDQREGI